MFLYIVKNFIKYSILLLFIAPQLVFSSQDGFNWKNLEPKFCSEHQVPLSFVILDENKWSCQLSVWKHAVTLQQ